MTRFALVLAASWLAASLAFADPPKIDRTIGKEPVYQTKAPRYGLLVFGPEGKDRVWLVLDGDTLYVDRNGNGDLTEPGEKIAAQKNADRDPAMYSYTFEVGDLTLGGHTHKGLTVSFRPLKLYDSGWIARRPEVKAALAKDPQAAGMTLWVHVAVAGMKGGGLGGRVAFQAGLIDLAGVLQLADTPRDAPAVHCGGPLQVTFYGGQPTLRVGRDSELVLVIGTPGVGPGTFAMIEYQDTIPEDAKPVAEVSLPSARAGAPPLREKYPIKGQC